jgi:hypothetical protein
MLAMLTAAGAKSFQVASRFRSKGSFDARFYPKSRQLFGIIGLARRDLPPRPAPYFSGGVANSFPVGTKSLV